MTMVVDSSVAAKWFLKEPGSAEAEDLLARDELIAPDLIIAEILSVLWKNVRMKRIGPEHLDAIAHAVPKHLSAIVPLSPLSARAGEIALALDRPVYDAFNIALAERENCILITADDRLFRKTRRTAFSKLISKLL